MSGFMAKAACAAPTLLARTVVASSGSPPPRPLVRSGSAENAESMSKGGQSVASTWPCRSPKGESFGWLFMSHKDLTRLEEEPKSFENEGVILAGLIFERSALRLEKVTAGVAPLDDMYQCLGLSYCICLSYKHLAVEVFYDQHI